MAVIETRLSPKVETGFSAMPVRFTRVRSLQNGHERRNANWTQARRRYTGRYGNFTREQREELMNCVMACSGQLYAFLFKDWSDYSVTGQSLGVAPSGSTAVQLVKTYTFGNQAHSRTITRPVANTVVVYQSGVAKAGTVDATTGLFTPSTAWTPGAPLTADFEFNVPVRFASDETEFVLPHRDITEVNVELIEVVGE